ncbi:LamG-like jellyroll fold domain-containing protein [Calothrix sp. NIES-2098]|uniref:LamG-like jellyroll fold domain-containing protein n=1 Tax=Calothrix sp. NIES-2098 TaxID=1954171 RepID=UPI000B603ED0|nr:hypothetical protein NIES2098_38130 [Calothrix sp. NIES-2098]
MTEIKDLAITKTEAGDNDWLILQEASTGQTYKIKVSDFLAGLSNNNGNNNDQYASNVSLLLGIVDGSLVDLSSNGFTLTNNGASINADNQIVSNGGTTRITTPDDAKFYLSDDSFTAEVLAIPTTLNNDTKYFISQANNVADNANRQFAFGINQYGVQWYWTTNGSTDQYYQFAYNFSVDTLYHVAVVRKKDTVNETNKLACFVNGAKIGEIDHSPTYFNSTASLVLLGFGNYSTDGYTNLTWQGKIKNRGLRLTKGIARYSSNFTSPTTF